MFRPLFVTIAVISLLALPPREALSQQSSQQNAADQVAQQSLPLLQKLATEQTYKALGFESPAEARQAQLGPSIQLFMVRLDQLREYEPNADPNKLLVNTNEIIFPITFRGQVRTGMYLREFDGKWHVATFGRATITRLLAKGIEEQAHVTKTPPASFFAVNIPALNLYFIARRFDSTLQLTPVLSDSRFTFQLGHALPGREIFSAIVPYARKLKTGPYIAD